MMNGLERYIKMSDCPEIQEGHEWEYGDRILAEHGVFIIGDASFHYDNPDETKPPIRRKLPVATIDYPECKAEVFTGNIIWLPYQHQLQEMMIQGKGSTVWAEMLKYFLLWLKVEMPNWYFNVGSMEQLWLSFVMKEKYNKVWHDAKGEWIKV